MIPDAFAIAIGGAIGSVLRYLITVAAQTTLNAAMVGTLIVNVVGCLLIGMMAESALIGISMPQRVQLGVRVGLLGGLTTFSTFGLDTVVLSTKSTPMLTGAYVAANLVLGIAAVWIGMMGVRNWAS